MYLAIRTRERRDKLGQAPEVAPTERNSNKLQKATAAELGR